MAVGIDADTERLSRGSIPSGGAGTLCQGGFASFGVGVWLYRPSSGNSYGLTSDGHIISLVAAAREMKLGFDNTFGAGTASDPLLQIIFNSGGGTGATQTFASANLLDEWVFYFICADTTNQYAGYMRLSDLTPVSITRANDNAGSQYVNTLAFGNNGSSASAAVMGHYAYARAIDADTDVTAITTLATSAATDAGDWGFWPMDDNADTADDSGNSRDLTFTGTLTSETSPSFAPPTPLAVSWIRA